MPKAIKPIFSPIKRGDSARYEELGTTGNYFMAGREIYEYQNELKGWTKFDIYDKMVRGSAMARATVMSIILPLLGAVWLVRPYGKKRKRSDLKVCEFVENNLFRGMYCTWTKLLFEILRYVVFGYIPFEKVWIRSKHYPRWTYGGDHVILKKLSPRHPYTIYRFRFDEDGELAGLVQNAYFNVGDSNEFKFVELPAEKLVLFINEEQGDNYEGVSILRSGYGHWRTIQQLYNIGNIGIERMCVGYPVIEYPEDFWTLTITDRNVCKQMAQDVLNNFRAHQHSGAIIPPKMKFHMIKGEFDSVSLERFISHHEMKIAQSALASFLKIGETRVGSHSLSKDQSDFFLKSLIAIGQDICDTINLHLIPEMVDMNFKGVDGYPILSVRDIGARDLKEFAEILRVLTQSFILTPDEEGCLEDDIRKMFDLPERTEDQIKKIQEMVKNKENVFAMHPANHYAYQAGVGMQSGITNPMGMNKGVQEGVPPPGMGASDTKDLSYNSIAEQIEGVA